MWYAASSALSLRTLVTSARLMSSVGLAVVMEQLSERGSPGWLAVCPCSAGPGLVIVVVGEADWVTADQMRHQLAAALAYGPRSLVLDLTDLEFCNLTGLRALLAAVETAERAGVDVTLHGMSPQLAWLYERFPGRRTYRRHSGVGIPGVGSAGAAARAVPFA